MDTKTAKQVLPRVTAKANGGSLIGSEKLRQLYAAMLKCRLLEERACLPAGQRRIAASIGHEAAEVGCTIDLHKKDAVASGGHDLAGRFLRGIPLRCMLSQPYGHLAKSGASDRASLQLSAGVELARRFKKTRNVVVAFSSAGGFSDGIWHEALSTAGAESLPILFVRRERLSKETGNAKPGSPKSGRKPGGAGLRDYGFPCIPVDGHDVVAVYRVAHESIQRARRGDGPTLIDCEPYLLDIQGLDTHGRKEWNVEMDPIRYMELYLTRKGLFRDSWKNRLVEEFSRKLDAAIDAAEQE